MEVTDLRKINEGISGSQAAKIIYENDRKLCEAIDSCAQELEANRVLAAQANSVSGRVDVTIAQETGDSLSEIMSQSAVTKELDSIQSEIDNMCGVSDIEGTNLLNITADTLTSAHTAQMAATDLNNRSISGTFDTLLAYMESSQETIAALKARIETLEKELEKKN